MAQFIEDDNSDHAFQTMEVRHYGDAAPTERGTESSDSLEAHEAAWKRTPGGYFADSL